MMIMIGRLRLGHRPNTSHPLGRAMSPRSGNYAAGIVAADVRYTCGSQTCMHDTLPWNIQAKRLHQHIATVRQCVKPFV